MEEIKVKMDLHNNGYTIIPFPQHIKEEMINHIKLYLNEVALKQTNVKKVQNSDVIINTNLYEENSEIILTMSDPDYVSNFSKPLRMFPETVTCIIIDWIKTEMRLLLGVEKTDSNYVSPAERKGNPKLIPTSYDIFWRCVRRDKNDVGPAHCDSQFWELAKNTEDEVPVPFSYRQRWKLWVPLLGCEPENMLQVIPFSHLEEIPMQITDTPYGKRPCLEPTWFKKNKARFIVPIKNVATDCVIFHDRLIHRGQKNHSKNLRISSEFTILSS